MFLIRSFKNKQPVVDAGELFPCPKLFFSATQEAGAGRLLGPGSSRSAQVTQKTPSQKKKKVPAFLIKFTGKGERKGW